MTRPQSASDLSPYNPWASYLVEASAGSGKTWQLSRRFLALVVAGADPSSILTVTFTRKAAAEMRERIVKDAIKLGRGSKEFLGFIDQVKSWRPQGLNTALRSPEQASRAILEKTQTLKITTIDSLFLQWCRRYPLETSINVNDQVLESPWKLLSTLEHNRLYAKAWAQVLSSAEDDAENIRLMRSLVANAPGEKIRSLLTAISPLTESETFAWLIKLTTGQHGLKLFDLPTEPQDPKSFLAENEALFLSVIALASNAEKREAAASAVRNHDLAGLASCAVLTANLEALNGNTFATAKKTSNPEFLALSQKLQFWTDQHKVAGLNRTSQLLWTLFEARANASHKLKVDDRSATFSDAVKGVSLLACDENLSGARAMAWSPIRHLMLDEFQDTSRLQWMIFEQLSRELLSGQSRDADLGPNPSVFIVGDKKQSIYRFREADPEVLDIAKANLQKFGLIPCNMSQSYRSSNFILNFVNNVFIDGNNIPHFPTHSSAKNAGYGSVAIYKILENKPDEEKSAEKTPLVEREAKIIAQHVKACLTGEIDSKVYDSELKNWRAPQPKDFVILYAKSTNSHVYEDALREQGIASLRLEQKGYYERPEIQDLLALVQWLAWPADTAALSTVLKSPVCGLSDECLQIILSGGSKLIWKNLKTNAPKAFELLDDLASTHHHESMSAVIGKLLTKYKIADLYFLSFGQVEGPLAKANVLKWFDLVCAGSATAATSADSLSKSLEDLSEADETGNASLTNNAVTLMTIHKSKGLEFPCVILAGSSDDWHRDDHGWIKDARPGQEGFWYIGNSTQRPKSFRQLEEILAYNEGESRSEKARLLYVALTRASNHIVITGAIKDDPFAFFALLEKAALELQGVEKKTLTSADTLTTIFTNSKLDVILHEPEEVLEKTEVIQLELKSKRKYPPLNILTPSAQSPGHRLEGHESPVPEEVEPVKNSNRIPVELSATFGSLVHKCLELKIKKQNWSLSRMKSFISGVAQKAISESEMERLIGLATSDISILLESDAWKTIIADAQAIHCELPMAEIQGENLVNAISDMVVIRNDGSIRVIDFKTSTVDPKHALAFCKSKGYENQVNAYKQIIKNAFKDVPVTGHILFTNPVCLVDLI